MADIVNLAHVRQERHARRLGAKDPERVEVFPNVSLADLWRLWAKTEQAKDPNSGVSISVRVG